MTWPFGQVVMFTRLARSLGEVGTTDGGADEGGADDGLAAFGRAVERRAPDFFSAMEHAGYLVLGRCNDAIRLANQQVLRPLTTKEAVGRRKPIGEAPIVLLSAEDL